MNFISVGEGLGLEYWFFEKGGGGLNCCILAMGENTSSVAFLKRKSVTLCTCTIIVNGNNFCSELELT